MKLFTFTIALLCASAAVFAQSDETTTVAPTTQAPASGESSEASTEVPTTVAPETKAGDSETTTMPPTDKDGEDKKQNEPAPGEQQFFGGRTGGNFFPHPNDPRVMFIPQTVRDPITGMIYQRRVPHFGPPNPHFRPPMQAPPQQPSFDPLGSFSEHQKKRQFFQDLLMTQLSRFEKEVDPMMEHETEEQGKTALVSILEAVHHLKKALENNQIFNISEIMKTWKEGKLPGQTAPPTESGASSPPNEIPSTTPAQSEQTPAEVVAVAEASPPVRAILLLPQRQREPTLILQRQQQQQPLYIRRFAVPSPDEQNLPPRGYPQEHGYIAGY